MHPNMPNYHAIECLQPGCFIDLVINDYNSNDRKFIAFKQNGKFLEKCINIFILIFY